MTVNDPIPSADDADLIEQSIDVDAGDDEYPATSHDSVSDEDEAIAPVSPDQRH
ncbi:hypothetical protein GIY30_12675 [Gordonia sp. HNM0687]|uniref:Uncharacterized protein n=1 Tax=Gordonia mangrovi TaxID=2665643 RepID=A0A6L7GS16_9ACTN|nr:hypothetical protein [Gordonia mangrovi]MXP22197.1 hypothetical protein [Gordonia mangrovi]UVF77897.1 hypothetical protein NWF22_22065 [Gordonia mangrovi]